MFLAALRRFLVLVIGVSLATAAGGLLVGLALGSSLDRAVYLAFYWVGSLVLLGGVFTGSRGPVRIKSEQAGPVILPLPLPIFTNRVLRWATAQEQDETINNSAVFVAVGLVLLVVGVLVDSRHTLF